MQYSWDWQVLFEEPYSTMLLSGAKWSLLTAAPAWFLAFLIGSLVAILRTSESLSARRLGTVYVEVFRNIPLLVQIFIWYFVVPELLPDKLGTWLKREFPAFATAAIGIALYHGARIGEVVRAGIESVGDGQRMAARALGLREAAVYRDILLPLAYRIAIPPLTSEFLAVFKHTSLALTIGVLEITARSREIEEFTFQGFEAFAAASLFYLAVTLTIMLISLGIENRSRVPGLMAAER